MDKCRICLRCRKNLLSINSKSDGITFADMMCSIANIKIRNDDGFSDQICRSCRGRLTEAYNFKMEIEKSDIILQETSNMKRINFSNLQDIKIKIEIDCKPIIPKKETFSDKLFEEGLDCISYNNTIIKKVEHTSEDDGRKKRKALSVGEFLNSIKTESDNDCDYDYEIDAHDFNSDSGSNYSYQEVKKRKYTKRKKKTTEAKEKKPKSKDWFKPLLANPIKPKYIPDLRLARTNDENNKPKVKTHNKVYKKKLSVCPYCGKLCRSLNNHIKLHSGERKFKCDQCPKAYFIESSLKNHMLVHMNVERKFKCDQCTGSFLTIAALNTHMIRHLDERKFVCDICNKAFKRKPILKRHKMIHNFGAKPIKCELCPMSFNTQYNLRHHMRVHTGERPFKCEICSQPYSYKHDFNRHCLKKHGVFLKRRSVHVMNEEVLQQERAIIRDLSLRAHGIIKGGEMENPFDGPQAALAYEQAMKAIEANKIPMIF